MATLGEGWEDNSIECPNCEIDLNVESYWDQCDTCPVCSADIEWDIDGDTESGFFFGDLRLGEVGS